MPADTSLVAMTAPSDSPSRASAPLFSRLLGWGVFALLVALLADVLLEGWIQQITGHWETTAKGSHIWVLTDWPKTVKSGLFLALGGVTLAKIAIDRRWRD